MKKVIIAVLLIAAVCIPAFAAVSIEVLPEVGVSASFSFNNGFKYNGTEVYVEALVYDSTYEDANNGALALDAKAGYLFTADKNPAVSGVYTNLALAVSTIEEESDQVTGSLSAKAGVSADFHAIDGSIKVNAGVVAGIHSTFITVRGNSSSDVAFGFGPSVEVRFNFINKTGAPVFALEAGDGLRIFNE